MRKLEIIKPERIEKGWGYELIIHNEINEYCGKILHFNSGGAFSMHYHLDKKESFYVSKGRFRLTFINPDTTELVEKILNVDDVIEIHRGIAHQLHALEESEIFEVSTYDKKDDSYRIFKGDSQL